jgi:NAD(P)-dependent dehydrogenase (short-subunit alcohol dehydrogenase family)
MTEPRLRILIVGATGTLGSAVVSELASRHDIITAGRNSGDINLDLEDPKSIIKALASAGKLNAVISAAGNVHFAPLSAIHPAALGDSTYTLGLANKLMGQVNLALAARDVLAEHGSITLTSGITCDHPIAAGSSASMVNGALEAFVRAAAIELPRGLRINLISPNVLVEAMAAFAPFFRGFEPVPAARAALAFSRSVEGLETGKTYKIY